MPTWTKAFGQYVNLIVTATESEVSVANNTSKVTVNAKLHYHTGQTSTANWNAISYYLKIDGTSYVSKPKTTSNGYSLSSSSRYKDLGTYSKTITHDSDGSKSINVYVDFDDHDGWRALVNETMKLTTIARASIPTASATSIAIGSAITIYTNRKSSSFRHELTFKFASRAVDTLMTTASTADRVTWTLPNDMANAIPNSTSNGGTFTLKTYNGSTLVGTNTISITVTVPSNSTFNPTMGTPSYTDVGAAGVTGVIDGKSKLKLTGTASPKMGATVKSIKLNFSRPGYSTSYDIERSGNTGTYTWGANTVATWSISMTVTDSRGRSATSGSISVPVVAYSAPKLSVKATRSGTNIVLSGNATGVSLSSSNTLTLETYIRIRGTTSWGTAVNTTTSKTGTVAPTVTTYSGYATSTSYEVRVRVKDTLSDWAETILHISTNKVLLDIYKDVGVGMGKYYEPAIGGALQIEGGLYGSSKTIINTDGNFGVQDTRSVSPPTDIGDKGVVFDFKANGIDGLSDGGLYHGVMTFQQWSDSSGGLVHQLGFGYNSLWFRNATIGSTWGPWKQLANTTDLMDFNHQTYFRSLARFHSSVDFYGNMYLNNNAMILGKDTGGVNRKMLHKGTDNHVHINADAHGSTFIHTSTLPRTQVYLGTRDYRWLQFNVKGNAKNASTTSPGSGSSISMWGSNSIFEMGLGHDTNEREGWIQVRHAENAYANAYGQLKLQPLGGSVYVGGTFSVAGSKNAIHATRDGFRLTPAYETAESYLGDIGESKTDYTNETKVYIETLFHDTVNTEVPYQVFLQSYGDGFVWVSERNYDHFIVKSSAPNIAFGWELKAKRRGYEEDRLVLSETTYEDAQTTEGLHGGYSTQSKGEEVIIKEEGGKI